MDQDRINVQLVCNGKKLELSSNQIIDLLDYADLSGSEYYDLLNDLAESPNSEIRERVASHANISEEVLKKLALDPMYAVRKNVLDQEESVYRLSAEELIESANGQSELIKIIFDSIGFSENHPGSKQLVQYYSQSSDPCIKKRVSDFINHPRRRFLGRRRRCNPY